MRKRANKKTGIRDIAISAGVCAATVSRTLSNPKLVSSATREKVMAAVEALDYTPDKLAAGLANGKSRNIVVLLPDITNLFFVPMIQAIERVAFERNYSVLLGDTMDDAEIERSYGRLMFSRQAEGFIITSQRLPFDLEKIGTKHDVKPIVSTGEPVFEDHIQKCIVDNVKIGETATRHLLELGHRRIAVIAGPKELRSCQDRLAGFRHTMSEAGVAVDERLINYGNYSIESGAECVQRLLHFKERPTAIFSLGDMAALGALYALHEAGFSIPEDISIIGVDGIQMGEFSIPPLTTVAQPITNLGTRCAESLLDIIEGKKQEPSTEVLAHTLIQRRSTGPVKSAHHALTNSLTN